MSDIESRNTIDNSISNQHLYKRDNEDPNNLNSDSVLLPEYNQETVTALEWIKETGSNPIQRVTSYFISLFPILQWIFHYNFTWLYSDLIAGITVGIVLVPQSMSYAQLAGLSAEYGLYSSFIGVFTYCIFATSKDVSIGPVAVMSLQVSKSIAKVQEKHGDEFSAPLIATTLALVCGGIAAAIGVLRLGFILEFISVPAVMGFMSGSALNIISGQVPALMGYNKLVNTRDATYKVIINSLKNLKHSKVDAAFGLVPLFLLYLWKYLTNLGAKRYPKYKKLFFFIQVLRNAVIIVFATLIAWGAMRIHKGKPFSTIGKVPSGLKHVEVFHVPKGILSAMASEIPVSTIILLLEHIAIAKSFGRVNDYKINPDQELIAIGVNNLIGTFFHAYPSTGSFSRSALKAKCGVRTPLAGIFTGGVVLLALYCLTKAFYYIPKATLSAIIIHAVSDLIASYQTTWSFWKIAPLDCGIFVICVIITVFASIEDGIYFAICASAAVLLFRIAKSDGLFLGKIRVAEVIDPIIEASSNPNAEVSSDSSSGTNPASVENIEINSVNIKSKDQLEGKDKAIDNEFIDEFKISKLNPNVRFHTRWVPLSKDNVHQGLKVTPPPPGVLVFKPVETFTYPNCSRMVDKVSDEAKRLTRRGVPYEYSKPGDRPWNDPAPLNWKVSLFKKTEQKEREAAEAEIEANKVDERPILRIVHFDFSTVASIDATAIQNLVDLRKALNTYADREVEFHFSGILSPWVRRALLNAGFGRAEGNMVSNTNYFNIGTDYQAEQFGEDEESQYSYLAVTGTNTPFFHFEIPSYDY